MQSFKDARVATLVKRIGQRVEGLMPKEMPNVTSGMIVVVLLGDTVCFVEGPEDYNVVKNMFGDSGTVELFAVDWSYFNQTA